MRKAAFLLILVSIATQLPAQQWSVQTIDPLLRKNASVVKRFEANELKIEDPANVTLKVHQVYTVLNEEGFRTLVFNQYTTKYISLKDADIKVYDSLGRSRVKYKKKDLQVTAIGEGLISDGQINYLVVNPEQYPLSVEYEYELNFSGTLGLPVYSICNEAESVESSSFTVRVPAALGFRFLPKNTRVETINSTDGSYQVYAWRVSNLPATNWEEGTASAESYLPAIYFSLNKFSFYGKEGDMSSWRNFGAWIRDLYKGLDEIPAEKQAYFRELVSAVKDPKAKAKLIYDYLQKNFRYVSIQLGIGGIVPFSASFTDAKKYGDCKSLSNYMMAALKSVGIRSHVAIINAGHNVEPVDPSFPMNHFNHAILCIPGEKDSTWLECTSSNAVFGELGTFTQNRNALLITEKGGELVSTPSSRSSENCISAITRIEMSEEEGNRIQTIFRSSGDFREGLDRIYKEKKDEQKEAIVMGLGFKQPDEFEISQQAEDEMLLDTLNMIIEKVYEFKAGNKYFLAPRLYKVWTKKLPVNPSRKMDYCFKQPYELTDTTIYVLPKGFKADVLPPPAEIKCEFATYTSSYWYDEKQNAVCSRVKLVLKQQRIPAAKYNAIQQFADAVLKEDAQRIVVRSE